MEHLNYEVCLSYPSKLLPGHMGRGGGEGVLPCYTIGEVCPPCVIFKSPLVATLDMYSVWTEKVYCQMCTNMSL